MEPTAKGAALLRTAPSHDPRDHNLILLLASCELLS
jgi:hypothetical protein